MILISTSLKPLSEILKCKKPGDLFSSNNLDSVKKEYREYARFYHPDMNKSLDAENAFKIINELYDKANKMISEGIWEVSNQLILKNKTNGKKYITKYLSSFNFELGVCYIADKSITYLIDGKFKNFYENALMQIGDIHYANKDMENQFSIIMPKVRFNFETDDGRYCIILAKTDEVFCLKDVLNYYNNKVPDRHVAWIMSRLCNICCLFDYMGIVHNGLSLENLFISPVYHTILPLGGWWYTRPVGEKMIGTTKEIYDVMSVLTKTDKLSSSTTDIESIKLVGRSISDMSDSNYPSAISVFLNDGSEDDAKKTFRKWNKTLDDAYGERKFIEMNITKKDIYKED